MELIKDTIKLGNSAGVLLPRDWLGNRVKITLEPKNTSRETLEILEEEKVLSDVLGVYLVGSYAREEQTIESDVDVLVITSNTDKTIKKGQYEIICISKDNLEKQLISNLFPILPMIKEGKTIINNELIKNYLNTKISQKNVKYYLDTTESILGVIKEDVKFSRDANQMVSDASAYSIILRIRTLYIINCLKTNKLWSKKEFLNLIRKISGSTLAYERYLSSKNNNTSECKLPIEEAEKLIEYLTKELEKTKRWFQEKKD